MSSEILSLWSLTLNTYKIYKWTNLITGMSYVGQTKRPLERRAGSNMSGYRGCNRFWEAIQHYGTDCWAFEILWDGLTLDEANVYEEIEIRDNETLFPYGYNLTTGGLNSEYSPESRKKISENSGMKCPEVRAKVSASHKGKKLSAEHRRKIGEAGKGRKVSAETRKKLSAIHKGRKISAEHRKRLSENNGMKRPEVRAKVSASHKGKKLSAEHRKKIGENNGWKGKRLTAEHRKKMSEGRLGMSQEALIILVGWLLRDGWSKRRIARELRKGERTILRYAKLVE